MGEKKSSYKVVDAIKQQKIDAGLQPFKLVKYFSFSSLGVILIFTLFQSWVISNHARNIMLDQSKEYSVTFAENLNLQVFYRFVLTTASRYGVITLSNPDQFENLDKIIREITQGMKIESVTIFDSKVNVISYSTVAEMVGVKDVGELEYEMALNGLKNSKFIYSGSVLNLIPGTNPVNCLLKTYIPFRQVNRSGESSDIIMGVIEIVRDLSSEYNAIIRLQGSIVFVSTVVMMFLFLVLRTIVARASIKMEQRAMERLQLEEKLNQSERLAHLGTMVATVSHEIKNPLGIVRSTAEILEKRIKKVAAGNEHLAKIIIDETSRLNSIVMEFLDFARPQQVNLEKGNINEVIRKTLVFIYPQVAEQKIVLHEMLDNDPKEILLDEELLYRGFLNIFLNALQSMNDGGTLLIITRRGPGNKGMEIEISDTGKGISNENIEYIYDPFFTDKNRGTGLGLAITKNIIESHNGTIKVNSDSKQGTTFTIYLP